MADNQHNTYPLTDNAIYREVFSSLQLATFFKVLVNESPGGESCAFMKLERLIDLDLPIQSISKRGPGDESYRVPAEALKAAVGEAKGRWQPAFDDDVSWETSEDVLEKPDDGIWQIRVSGIPEGYYAKLGALWVCEDDYRDACVRLGDTSYHWPAYPWLTAEDELVLRSVAGTAGHNLTDLLPFEKRPGRQETPRGAKSVGRRSRTDSMRNEIENAIRELGDKWTSDQVMDKLKTYAGKKGSCITEAHENFVLWRSTKGDPCKLTMNALRKRISRRTPSP